MKKVVAYFLIVIFTALLIIGLLYKYGIVEGILAVFIIIIVTFLLTWSVEQIIK